MRNQIAIVVLTVWLAACSGAQWPEFQPPQGGFKVSLPGKPNESVSTESPAGAPLSIKDHRFHLKIEKGFDAGKEFFVGYAEYEFGAEPGGRPAMDTEAAYAAFRARAGNILSQHQVSITAEHDIDVEGTVGKQFDLANAEYQAFAKIFMKNDRIYYLAITAPKAKDLSADRERFFSSFRLM